MPDQHELLTDARQWVEPNAFTMMVPRSEALAWGHAEPTQEEVDAARARVPERYAEQVTAWEATRAFLAALDAADLPPLGKRILELHQRASDHAYAECRECDGNHGSEWPCATVRAVCTIAEVDVPDDLVYKVPVLSIPDPDNPRWPYPAGPVTWGSLFPKMTIDRAILYGLGSDDA